MAALTNNQAVTNIIESFGKIQKINQTSNFEERLVNKIESFAVSFPSFGREKEAKESKYQITNSAGEKFVKEIECKGNLEDSTQRLLECYGDFFGERVVTLSDLQVSLHNKLRDLHQVQQPILNFTKRVQELKLYRKI